MKIRKDIIVTIINCLCVVVCTAFAGCRLSVGNFQLQDVNGELFTTNTIQIVER